MEKIVIIPALNPDETLKEIVESNRKLGNLVILVDDGSDENRRGLFEYLGEKCIVLRHRENRGKGEAIKTALRYIKKELWQYLKAKDKRLYLWMRNGIMGGAMNLPGKGGRRISVEGYKICQKLFGFN